MERALTLEKNLTSGFTMVELHGVHLHFRAFFSGFLGCLAALFPLTSPVSLLFLHSLQSHALSGLPLATAGLPQHFEHQASSSHLISSRLTLLLVSSLRL